MRPPAAALTASAMPKSATIGAAVVQQDVLGLDVAMDDALAVGVVEGVGDSRGDAHRLVDRSWVSRSSLLAQRLALDEGHDVVEEAVRRARVEQRQDVRVRERGGGLDLGDEALGAEDGGELRLAGP